MLGPSCAKAEHAIKLSNANRRKAIKPRGEIATKPGCPIQV
jgi:hypothetical protein